MPTARRGHRGPGPAQLARTLETREKVLRAAIEIIAEHGLDEATGPRIAERSGVSWGGIQHQFGDKAAILDAVLDRVLIDFQDRIARFAPRATSVEGRIRALVDATWDLMRDSTYQAFREVMRAARTRRGGPGARALRAVAAALEPMRDQLFPELSERRRALLNLVLFATLSGMAEQARYGVVAPQLVRKQLEVLRGTLASIVSDA